MKLKTKYRYFKVLAIFLVLNIVLEFLFPVYTYALTTGPSQPEVQSFAPVNSSEMVDLFTGDFSYNIPLFELPGPNGGYPFNLIYNSGIKMDQEATWTGLGWNINPGSISRQMRGLPDEFNGKSITKETYIKPNVTVGVNLSTELEIFGAELTKLGFSNEAKVGVGVYYNNYSGPGYDANVKTSFLNKQVPIPVDLKIGVSSNNGVSTDISANLNMKVKKNHNIGVGVSFGYNSMEGMTKLDFKGSYKHSKPFKDSKNNESTKNFYTDYSAPLTRIHEGYTPKFALPMMGRSFTVATSIGLDFLGIDAEGALSGYFNTQYLQDNGQSKSIKSYGYMFQHNAKNDKDAITDFNRVNEGVVRDNTPNLAMPIATHDIYTATAQGVYAMYRPYRNDVSTYHDPYCKSVTVGGSGGVEFGAGQSFHLGINPEVTGSIALSSEWPSGDNQSYRESDISYPDTDFEKFYFKTYGELTSKPVDHLDYLMNDKAVRIKLKKNGMNVKATGKVETSTGTSKDKQSLVNVSTRESRNTLVQPVNNNASLEDGMYVLNPDGTRYIYSKRVINKKSIECLFATGAQGNDVCSPNIDIDIKNGKPNHKKFQTDHYYNKTEIPEYAHTFLLEQIIGADYIDADGIAGPSDGDFGYWVKFNYTPTSTNYKWRSPFVGANYIKGLLTTAEDDKGSYMYGEREVYYLSSVETKSHKAKFYTSPRKDAYGAKEEYQNSSNDLNTILGDYSFKLDNIKVYSKKDTINALKSVYFDYSYDLCKGVINNKNTQNDTYGADDYRNGQVITNNGGKLTLKKVWFTYEKNKRGGLSPYEFNYHETNSNENPNYSSYKYDRWGNYKKFDDNGNANTCSNIENPYTPQFSYSSSQSGYTNFRQEMDMSMSAWNLKEITLPSGGKINVEYEADDYGYVQDKTAMQMFRIASLDDGFTSEDEINPTAALNSNDKRVYFRLEEPIEDNAQASKKFERYFDKTNKIYFKVFMYVRRPSDDRKDYVSGYATIESKGLDPNSKVNGKYTRGYISLGNPKERGSVLNYHPFSYAAWQYIYTQNPLLSGFGPYTDDPNQSKSQVLDKVRSLAGSATQILRMMVGFNTYALAQGWGTKLDLSKSYIRLNSPDKIKIGGGCRVKKLIFSDEWNTATKTSSSPNGEANSEYGQVYDYTIEEDGDTISSGVATYEPTIGGEENALKRNKDYIGEIPLKSDLDLFIEYPINEAYYPAPAVGYRKVTVKSLATDNESKGIYPAGIKTTGATVNEFYTSKEFPVLFDETHIQSLPSPFFLPLPLVGSIREKNMAASQGYCTILNDMNGKLRKVSTYAQDKNGNILYDNPVSWMEPIYNATEARATSSMYEKPYFKLTNKMPVLVSDKNGVAVTSERIIGEEYEYFTDMRYSNITSGTIGLAPTTEVLNLIIAVIPVGTIWPTVIANSTEVKLAVTNKIIHRSGIVTGMRAYSDGSTVTTKHKLFDVKTGNPVLSSITNEYEDPIYTYSLKAYQEYETCGQAYLNTGLFFSATLTNKKITSTGQWWESKLVEGDEFVVGLESNTIPAYVTGERIVYKGKQGNQLIFAPLNPSANIDGYKKFSLLRSGRRNLLNAEIQTIRTLGSSKDPVLGNPVLGRKN